MADKVFIPYGRVNQQATFEGVFKGLTVNGLEAKDGMWKGHCPLHDKKKKDKPRFSANEEKKTFKCFNCEKSGSILDFVKEYKGIQLQEAALWLSALNGKEPTDKLDLALKEIREVLVKHFS